VQGAYCPSVVVLYPAKDLDPPQESVVPAVVEEGEDLGDLQGAIARRLLMCLCVRDDGGGDVVQPGLESLSDRALGSTASGIIFTSVVEPSFASTFPSPSPTFITLDNVQEAEGKILSMRDHTC